MLRISEIKHESASGAAAYRLPKFEESLEIVPLIYIDPIDCQIVSPRRISGAGGVPARPSSAENIPDGAILGYAWKNVFPYDRRVGKSRL
jgi:hypothetical protein